MRAAGVVTCLAMAVSVATGLQGQSAPGEVVDAFCWSGKALPACRTFVLFELEGALAVASTSFVYRSDVGTTGTRPSRAS